MNSNSSEQDSYRSFQLMTEIESGESISQRELAGRLGVAVGLVNSYLKNFVAKGYIRVKAFPRNRYGYLLTPKGFSEKSRLAYQHLSHFNNLYTVVRRDYLDLFGALSDNGVQEVSFCGIDEVAEIAYLSLQEVGLGLSIVFDTDETGKDFFGHPVRPVVAVKESKAPIILTSRKRSESLRKQLLAAGFSEESIFSLDM